MGRLTLNVLLSFAQFEREVTGERIRDKIAQSKARGMWMGGVVPLGYAVADRKLIICEEEARTVVHIFERYLALGSVPALAAELEADGIGGRPRRVRGELRPSRPMSRGALYLMLRNRIYRGEIVHKGKAHAGEHRALLDADLFERAQSLLDHNRVERGSHTTCADPSLLAGLLFDGHGRRMSPSRAVKEKTRHYRYYVSRDPTPALPAWRVPAGDIEMLVIERICALLTDRAALFDALAALDLDAAEFNDAMVAGGEHARTLGSALPHDVHKTLAALVSRIRITKGEVVITVRRIVIARRAGEYVIPADDLILRIAGQFTLHSRKARIIVATSEAPSARRQDPALVKLMVKAHAARKAALAGGGLSVEALARDQGYKKDYFGVLLRIAHLSPNIVCQVIDGKSDINTSRQQIARMHVPLRWSEEER